MNEGACGERRTRRCRRRSRRQRIRRLARRPYCRGDPAAAHRQAVPSAIRGDADESGAVELTDSDSDDDIRKKAKKPKKAKKSGDPSGNPFLFVLTYLKQVVAELRKVIWPNRKQMGSYTSVVLAFLVFMVTLIGLVDLGLAKLVLLVFG